MKHISCTVGAIKAAFGAHTVVTLRASELPRMRPGQALLIRLNDTVDPYLPSAYFPLAPTRPGELALLSAAGDPICNKPAGEALDIIAPLGSGFALDASTRRLLLVGDGARLAPLLALAHEALDKQIAVSLLAFAVEPEAPGLGAWLSEMLPLDVEYQVSAQPAALLPALLGWADQVCAAGDGVPYATLRELAGRAGRLLPGSARTSAREARAAGSLPPGFVQVIVAPLMACGSGACQGCAVETVRGMRLACVDGPVFDLAELS